VLGRPQHDYTKSLIAAVPRPTSKLHRFPLIGYGGRVTEFAIEDLARSWPRTPPNAATLIEADGITKRFVTKASILPSRREYFTAVDAGEVRDQGRARSSASSARAARASRPSRG
jgi:peptide/nickel transport system ATP-binding protein